MASKGISTSISNLVLELTYFWKLVLESFGKTISFGKQGFIKEDLYQNVLTC